MRHDESARKKTLFYCERIVYAVACMKALIGRVNPQQAAINSPQCVQLFLVEYRSDARFTIARARRFASNSHILVRSRLAFGLCGEEERKKTLNF